MRRSTVGSYSCNRTGSCGLKKNIKYYTRQSSSGNKLSIGRNSCNLVDICRWCENDSVVPDFACNGDKDDYTETMEPKKISGVYRYKTCNYCRVSTKYTTFVLFLFFLSALPLLTIAIDFLSNSPNSANFQSMQAHLRILLVAA